TGRRSGLPREIEIWFVEADGGLFILAEHGYRAHWVQNVLKNNRVRIRFDEQQRDGLACVLDAERDAEAYARARQLAREKYGWAKVCPSKSGSFSHTECEVEFEDIRQYGSHHWRGYRYRLCPCPGIYQPG